MTDLRWRERNGTPWTDIEQDALRAFWLTNERIWVFAKRWDRRPNAIRQRACMLKLPRRAPTPRGHGPRSVHCRTDGFVLREAHYLGVLEALCERWNVNFSKARIIGNKDRPNLSVRALAFKLMADSKFTLNEIAKVVGTSRSSIEAALERIDHAELDLVRWRNGEEFEKFSMQVHAKPERPKARPAKPLDLTMPSKFIAAPGKARLMGGRA